MKSNHYYPDSLAKRPRSSAANDFWGKTFLAWSGEKKMNPLLSVLTGCSAGATESFVVVPFELVKIKYVPSGLQRYILTRSSFTSS